MITREVQLHTGLKIGDDQAMLAVIREETLGDELEALSAGLEGLRAHRKVMTRRVTRIGALDNPTEEILAKLTRTDWDLIERALEKMDLELAVEAGLVIPASGDTEAGRAEPGGAAPGDV